MKNAYVMTWIQNGKYMYYTPKRQDTEYVINMWVDACLNFLPEDCSDNKLFNGTKLVAREATYKGI